MIYLLTQDNCPKCNVIKQFIDKGLSDVEKAKIQIVHRQSDEKLFMELVTKHNIMSTPVLVGDDGCVLVDASISNVRDFVLSH